MNDQSRSGVARQARPHQDGWALLALALLCLILIGGLAVLSRGSPSAAQRDSVALPISEISPDEGCANFARYWTDESGLGVRVEAIEGLTNCRLSPASRWFVPDGADDPRLTERSVLTRAEAERADTLRALIMDDLSALDVRLPNSLIEALTSNYADENMPVFGHTKRGRTDFGVKHARYQRIAQAFLLSPSRIELANYVGWVMERKSVAVGDFEAACSADPDTGYLLRACAGMRREFGAGSISIYWELSDPVLIEEYLAWTVRSGLPLPDAISTASIE
jgi:hypothetical protein